MHPNPGPPEYLSVGKATIIPTYEPGDPLRCEIVAEVCPLPAELEAGHQVVVLPRVHAQHERLQYVFNMKRYSG